MLIGNDNNIVEVELINCERVILKEGGIRKVVIELDIVFGVDINGLKLGVIVIIDVTQVILKSRIEEAIYSGSVVI